VLKRVHTDVCGPMNVTARGGYRYFITFTDNFSRFGYVYLMKEKSEALEKFITYRLEVEKWTDNKLKSINSDRGGEYFSNDFERCCIENGIVHFCTPPYTPEANGIAERCNRTLLDMVRSMMARANLPTSF
jgi:transposase InsO family protein